MSAYVCWAHDKLYRPAYDEKLRAVDDWVADADVALKYVRSLGVAVQAGGAYGIWPLRLAALFGVVYTFEPDHYNFSCLAWNTRDCSNVVRMQAALGCGPELVGVVRDPSEANNAGAGYVQEGRGGVPTVQLDHLGLHACDLLCLDVEGHELYALQGARQTVIEYRPVVMLEAKQLPHMRLGAEDAVRWLVDRRDYVEVARVHRDVVLVPRERA